MLLRPEHFEQLTARQELLLQRYAAAAPFAWGVSKLRIDESALLDGRFTLLELEATLPDGLSLCVGTEWPTHPTLDLTELDIIFQQQPFRIYAAALALEAGTDRLRYTAVSESDEALRQNGTSLPDDDQLEEELPIPRLRPRFSLIAAHGGLSSKYTGMPVARVVYRNGAWELDGKYMAPADRVAADSVVGSSCSATLRRIREFALFSQNRWRTMSAQERAESPNSSSAIRQMVAGLPTCEALLNSSCAHPFSLYLGFCSLVGHIAGLSAEPIPPVFRAYDHNDLMSSFAELNVYLNQVLGEIDARDYLGVLMTYSKGVFSVPFAAEWSGYPLILGLRAAAGNDAAAGAWIESALIGSRSLQESMRERRVLGAERRLTSSEKGLFAGTGVVLYQLQEDRDYVQVGEPLDIATGPSSPAANIPVEVMLYIRQASH